MVEPELLGKDHGLDGFTEIRLNIQPDIRYPADARPEKLLVKIIGLSQVYTIPSNIILNQNPWAKSMVLMVLQLP